MLISDVRCEYMVNPLGIDVVKPRISWTLEARSGQRGLKQSAYQIEVAADSEFTQTIWDSGKVVSDASIHIEVGDQVPRESRRRYYYRVKAWDQHDTATEWSETSFWEYGLLAPEEWQAEWIGASDDALSDPEQCPMLRRSFNCSGEVRSARVYATALGLYELQLNGQKVGIDYFTPGWTSYDHRLQYQTYDVTELLYEGDNVIGAMLGPGWYKGNLAWEGKKAIYGDQLALLVQLEVELANGDRITVSSDGEWRVTGSPILMSEIYHGETYDARLEKEEWLEPHFDASDWQPVTIIHRSKELLVAQENNPVRVMNKLRPKEKLVTPNGDLVIDMGQNMVGWVRFTVRGASGQEIVLQHAEVLDRDGNFYTGNLRTAKQTIRYILKGDGEEVYEPHFSFQGFRYVKVSGIAESDIHLEDYTGIVLHSDMPVTGTFECSHPLINQLQHNIEWGLKGNFLDVPTDCPQRDERLGWTGDAQMFIRTATFLHGVAPFFTKWLRDLKADQLPDGGVPFVIPDVLSKKSSGPDDAAGGIEFAEEETSAHSGEQSQSDHSSSAWGDAAVINPWTIYLVYGDKRLLEEQYDSMKAWVEYIRNQGEQEYLWNTGFHFGDWLALDAKEDSYVGATDRDFIATAFYAYSTALLQQTAEVLGKQEDAVKYAELYYHIVEAFRAEFVTPSGRLAVGTQTAQVLALMFELVDGAARDRAVEKLRDLLDETNDHLTTGFVGTPYLNHVLSANGMHDKAYKLLFQEDYPSWLYQVTKGATTIWEHWDGIKEDGTFWSDDMNSFNHYAYGSIGDWLYRVVAGIELDEQEPAYKRIIIRPQPGEGLDWVEARFDSMYGQIRSAWKKTEHGGGGVSDDARSLTLEVSIPVNTTAEIWLPDSTSDVTVTENGKALEEADGIEAVRIEDEGIVVTVGSGEYAFEIEAV